MFKIFRKNCCGLDVHKTWIYACIGITDANGRTDYKQARFSPFSKGLRELAEWLAKNDCKEVRMESSGRYWIPVFNILEKTCWVKLLRPKYTKPQKGNKTNRKDAKWICDLFMCDMTKPSFIPPPDIRRLRDLMRYRFKLTNILTGEKNRTQNCLTVSNLKLDDVFSDVFGKSSMSITAYILKHPGETFDVTPFVHKGCKHSIEEIQTAVDGSVSPEQATRLREILRHIDEIKAYKQNLEAEIPRLAAPYARLLELIHTVPGFSSDPMSAIALISEIGADMSVFTTAKHLSSWAGCRPRNDQSGGKRKSARISRAGVYLKPLLVQVANAVVKSDRYPEFKERYRRLKARRGHKKAVIAICRMFLTAIWNILSKLEPYSAKGWLVDRNPQVGQTLTSAQALKLQRLRYQRRTRREIHCLIILGINTIFPFLAADGGLFCCASFSWRFSIALF
ncbi:MAG: IS110 family transposase [Clostridiales bacterium]|jgi:transposase|nr:IS110 family transposase [Clostridiales bacterium]